MRGAPVVLSVFSLFVLFSAGASAADSAVADAAMKGDIALVRSLLGQKADVNQAQPDGASALLWAVRQDRLEMLNLLIGAGANVKAANRLGVTPLSLACINGNAATIEALLKAGADANAVLSEPGETPLMMAARTGNSDAVKVLLDHGADVNAKESSNGQTALMWAAAEGHSAVIKMLIERGADVNAHSHFQLAEVITVSGPFERAKPPAPSAVPGSPEDQSLKAIQAATGPDDKLALLLGFEKQFPQSKLLPGVYDDMLRIFEQGNDLRGIRGVLERTGPRERQLARTPAGGMTALMFAARENSLESVRILTEKGADPNFAMANGTTPAAVRLLAEKGAKLDAKDKQGRTPIEWADGLYRGGGIAPAFHLETVALLKQLSK
jgi:ankyrin repeat protein